MNELLTIFQTVTPAVAVLVVAGYLVKVYLEKRLEGLAGRLDQIAQTSLDIKKDVRGEERGELVALRVAIEEWEDYLQNTVFEYTMAAPQAARVEQLAQQDQKLFLKVKVEVVKVGIYLRDPQLEQRLMETVKQLRFMYYPLINARMPTLIDLQTRLLPIDAKMSAFMKSNMTDMTVAPTEQDRKEHAAIQAEITEQLRQFSDELVKAYPQIAERLEGLKQAINAYIYRPIHKTAIDKQ